jgi:selenocysteine lyase/cysteine desulfurase
MKTQPKKHNSTFFFTNADSSDAVAILQRMTQSLNLPVLGLIVKVNERDEVLNVELADEHTVKSLAIANSEVQT